MALTRPSQALSQKTNINPSVNRSQEATAEDFNETGSLFNEYAEAIEALQQTDSENPYYGKYTSLALLETAHPTAVTDAWAIIDAGAGVTPQIASWDDSELAWEITGADSVIHLFFNTVADLPGTGQANKDYITLDDMLVRVWHNSEYKVKSPLNNSDSYRKKLVKLKDTVVNDYIDLLNGLIYIISDNTNVTHLIFDNSYSNIMLKARELSQTQFYLNIYNTTKNTHIIADISDYELVDNDTKFKITITGVVDADIEIDDVLEFSLPLKKTATANTTIYNSQEVQYIKHPDNNPNSGFQQYDYIKDYKNGTTEIIVYGQYLGGDQSDIANLKKIQWFNVDEITETTSAIHVVAIWWQSNALPTTNTISEPFPQGTLMLNESNQIVEATTPLAFTLPSSGSGFMNRFANRYKADNPDVALIFVQCAVSGSGFFNGFWSDGGAGYNQMITRINTALTAEPTAEFKGWLGIGAETDASVAFNFEAPLDAMITASREDVTGADTDTPFVFAGIADSFVGTNQDRIDALNILIDTPNRNNKVAFASSAGLATSDGTHFTVASSLALGDLMYDAFLTVAPSADIFEADALEHWLFGTDNPTNAGLINSDVLTNLGTSPTINANNLVTAIGTFNGLETPYEEGANVTYCAVIEKGSNSGKLIFGTLTTTNGGASAFLQNELMYINTQAVNPHGIRSIDISQFADTDIIFVAYSINANGDNIIFVGNSQGSNIVSTDTGGTRVAPTHGNNLALGSAYYNSGTFSFPLTAHEFIVFDIPKTETELNDIYQRTIARMATRGITVE